MWNFSKVKKSLENSRTQLLKHSLYSKVDSIPNARLFLKSHIYAVWDFMSLLKSLQQKLTIVQVPWTPPKSAQSAYFINSIILGEESDSFDRNKPPLSHYELYLNGMKEIGSFSEPVESLINDLQQGLPFEKSLERNSKAYSGIIPASTFEFTKKNIKIAQFEPVHKVASCFLFGREDPIPEIFIKILDKITQAGIEVPHFKVYLERHIKVDTEDHKPLSENMIKDICGDCSEMWKEVYEAAEEALQARIKFWDGIEKELGKDASLYEYVGGNKGILSALRKNQQQIRGWGVEYDESFEERLGKIMAGLLGGPYEHVGMVDGGRKIRKDLLARWIAEGVDGRFCDKNMKIQNIEGLIDNYFS